MERQPNEVELEILNSIKEQLYVDYKASDATTWTTHIAQLLCTLGKSKGLVPYSSTEDIEHREWLWDVIWCEESNNDWKNFTNLILISETEWWSINEIISDFQKLFVGNAKYRILITEYISGTTKSWENILSECKKSLFSFGQRNNDYFIIALPYFENDGMEIKSIALTY